MKNTFLATLILIISSLPSCAEILELNNQESKINYTFSYLGVPVKKKFLPAGGYIDIEKYDVNGKCLASPLLKELKLDVKFTSKSSVFKKAINYDKYPDFKFWTELKDPIKLTNDEFIELEGYLSFHGVDQKIKIKLKSNIAENDISFTGFFDIKMTDFGIPQPKVFFIILDDDIRTKVELYTDLNEE